MKCKICNKTKIDNKFELCSSCSHLDNESRLLHGYYQDKSQGDQVDPIVMLYSHLINEGCKLGRVDDEYDTLSVGYVDGFHFSRELWKWIPLSTKRGRYPKTKSPASSKFVGVGHRTRNGIQYNSWWLQNRELGIAERYERSDNVMTEREMMMERERFILDNDLSEYFRLNLPT